jgi:prolyl 4-hydroxylase
MVDLGEFIHVYDDGLEPEVCNYLITEFENNQNLHERIDNDQKPSFTQLNITANRNINDQFNTVHNHLISKMFEFRNKYYDFVDKRVFPESHALEQFRIKKYNNDGYDKFDAHVDVQDYDSSRRYLAFLWYLNDVQEGGNTVFKDLIVTPKVGRVLIFPPLWMFPHIGESPISGPKYILSGYLHYK